LSYFLADAQKQERIEQMIADINKYKKLDKELTNLRQKHGELEKNLNSKITEITNQRDEVQKQSNQLIEKIQQYEKLIQNPTNQVTEELNNLKIENDQLRQSNWKNMEELNKLLNDQQKNQDTKSS
jgi:chromosome segregation ATPase